MKKSEQTQWAATYLVAAELTRRGYRVGWPMGNAPTKDLLVESPTGKRFDVDVKGGSYKSSQKSYWHLVQESRVKGEPTESLVFIFVRVPLEPGESADFFVLPHRELMNLHQHISSTFSPLTRKGTPYKPFPPGLSYKHLSQHPTGWDKLPK